MTHPFVTANLADAHIHELRHQAEQRRLLRPGARRGGAAPRRRPVREPVGWFLVHLGLRLACERDARPRVQRHAW